MTRSVNNAPDVQPLHLAVVGDEGYFPGVVVAVRSALRALPEMPINVYLVVDEIGWPEGKKAYLRRVVESAGSVAKVEFLTFTAAEWKGQLPAQYANNHMTYARLFLDRMLPKVRELLYIDSDVHIGRSLLQLSEMDLGECWGAAVQCGVRLKQSDDHIPVKNGGNSERPYFNAGVLRLNLERIRASGFFETTLRYVLENRDVIPQHDQSALNAVGGAEVHLLGREWNTFSQLYDRLGLPVDAPVNVHFTNPPKPWSGPYRDRGGEVFYQTWMDLVEDIGQPPGGEKVTDIARAWITQKSVDEPSCHFRRMLLRWFYRVRGARWEVSGDSSRAAYYYGVADLLASLSKDKKFTS